MKGKRKGLPASNFVIRGMVLLYNHTQSLWDPNMTPTTVLYVCFSIGQVKLADLSGKLHRGNIQDIKYMYPIALTNRNIPDI